MILRSHPFKGTLPGALLVLLAGCVTQVVVPQDWEREGRAASEVGDWNRAQGLWGEVLAKARGKHPEARLALGEALLYGGRELDAVRILRGGDLPEDLEIRGQMALGRAHIGLGQAREAGRVFSSLLATDPTYRPALVLYGESCVAVGRERKGIELLLRALRLDRGDGELAQRVALLARENGLLVEEGEAWRHRVLTPNAPAEAYLGAALSPVEEVSLGPDSGEPNSVDPDPKESQDAPSTPQWPVEEWLKKAVELDPQLGEAWFQLGLGQLQNEKVGEAIATWQTCLRVDPGHHAALVQLSTTMVDQGAYESARTYLDHALELWPEGEMRTPFEELTLRFPGGY